MSQFLFVVEIPPLPSGSFGLTASSAWSQFSHKADTTIKTVKGSIQLQPNAWLLPVDETLPFLLAWCALATDLSLSYSVVLIPDGAVIMALDVKP